MPYDLAIIVVTWNVRAFALDALRSLYADLNESGLSHIVYVVDSASSDGTADAVRAEFPQAVVIACDENVGFVRGNNLALRALGFDAPGTNASLLPRAVYLLNPDTITEPGATRALFDALMANARVGLVGAGLRFGDGRFQHSAFAFPGLRQLWAELFPTPGRLLESEFNGRYPRSLYDGDAPFFVDFVLGATMMLRREVIVRTGVFDERFFMYCEEIDWAWRIHRAGGWVYCVPTAHVIHLGGASSGQVAPHTVLRLWTSRLLLFDKHYPHWKRRIARWMIRIGMRLKIAQAQRQPESDERRALTDAYQQIGRLAAR